ncbi:hypothetical protein [Hymenobacter jeollabukensis]|uniref:Curlin n=1 Tax=Hymenobacter jeollabukensis TaxID=2025313 RepID=A0A5R8WKY6_9BACT|nr:hypothetical protein [Hymenobacter jeollabukensis]TLM89609.1 hypothetical protein FDY95_19870 [Hymenobacter jeollabukensis]
MKPLSLAVFSSALSILALPVVAQQNTDREGISNEQQLAERLGTERLPMAPAATVGPNTARLLQQGQQNEATVEQRYAGAAALGNLVQIVQAGAANLADIGQYGAANRTVVDQQGAGNRAESQLTGTGIESEIRQRGNQNVLQQDLSLDNRSYLVEQRGNGNELVQRESGAAPGPGYEVRMVGNGIRLTIEQGRVSP